MRRALALGAIVTALLVAGPAPAGAHPLGNFTVNRYTGIEISTSRVALHYVVDMAEIPTFQERDRIDADHDGAVRGVELRAYARALAPRLRAGLSLSAAGKDVALGIERAGAALRAGQGGLSVLRIEATFAGVLPDATTEIRYRDGNYAHRIGWREVVAYGSGGEGIVRSSVPTTSVSDALRSYPKGLLATPLDVDSASVAVRPGASGGRAGASSSDGVDSPGAQGGALAARFTALIDHDISAPFLAFALLLALAAGALHALGPGHGKSIMAAYLVGAEGRMRHAVIVGIAVSLMHTASVVALGLLVLGASRLFTPEAVFPWLSLVSGVVVLGLGAWLLRARVAAARSARGAEARQEHDHHNHAPGHDHSHEHAHGHSHGHAHGHSHGHAHGHPHGHAHGHPHGHGHAPPDVSPTSWKGLGVIALSGGLLPSPSALVVLLGAVALHRVVFGVVLVGAFSVGLAGALTAVGLLVIKARSLASRRYGARVTTLLPVLSAAAIFAIGLFLTTGAVVRL